MSVRDIVLFRYQNALNEYKSLHTLLFTLEHNPFPTQYSAASIGGFASIRPSPRTAISHMYETVVPYETVTTF